MSEQVISAETMDSDHRLWDHEHLSWMTEIQGWRTDYEEALMELAKIQERLSEYRKELDGHSRIIVEHQQRLRDHGRAMDEYQQMDHDLGEEFQASMARAHLEQAKQHESSRAVHAGMKTRQSHIMARLSSLSTVIAWNDTIKAYWAGQAPTGPAPHAEDFTIHRFADMIGISYDNVIYALGKEGFIIADPGMTIAALAEQKGIAPSDVYSAIKRHYPAVDEPRNTGQGRGLSVQPCSTVHFEHSSVK